VLVVLGAPWSESNEGIVLSDYVGATISGVRCSVGVCFVAVVCLLSSLLSPLLLSLSLFFECLAFVIIRMVHVIISSANKTSAVKSLVILLIYGRN
jgi:hypothetical protein